MSKSARPLGAWAAPLVLLNTAVRPDSRLLVRMKDVPIGDAQIFSMLLFDLYDMDDDARDRPDDAFDGEGVGLEPLDETRIEPPRQGKGMNEILGLRALLEF
ncbi:hypothetical protein F5B17DRAFT_426046 [Nemania serpens]|nr:hypothetical protein F5B17DRAFT_426046 [Nemania serpens]